MSTNSETAITKVFSEDLKETLNHIFPIYGGSINDSYKVTTLSGKAYFVKYNNSPYAKELLLAEFHGLNLLSSKGSLNTPKIVHFHIEEPKFALLILEFIDKCNSLKCNNWEDAASQLYQLHNEKNTHYGLADQNYIGSIVQLNHPTDTWIEFFGTYRLNHQGTIYAEKMHTDHTMLTKLNKLILRLPEFLECESPALLHGDLWAGNLILGLDNRAWFIDPSVYYGHYEVDLAMSKLFGGFPDVFYETYYSYHHPQPGFRERISIYQLYYLLAHLNMFGASYLRQIHTILDELI